MINKLILTTILITIIQLDIYGQTDIKNQTCVGSPDILDKQEVYLVVEKMPEYPGGQSKMFRDLSSRLTYPKDQKDLQTKVVVTFIIDTLGHVRNECIYRPFKETGISPLEKKVLEVIKSMPRWTPGEINKKKVPVRIVFPIQIEVG